ncbi:hypothetical protein GXW83_14070 [Streptacidiphilus sp. PB12-B1b]|uniref:hypothetical protein n=1 Tax=Streptacidiphilus sp. PB12-B1b TaxID=2705012 RepID=UPI0015FD01CE|nr:hypothetical protein [Streptacidiphilus sp. PB12-B1b]QMU76701.1 hypothetical protein GXW83_14070 [Streptacidiphilus sp. PB12-B1b]
MPSPGLRLAVELAAWWALLFGLYLVFVSTVAPLGAVVGAAASALGAAGAWAVHRAARPTLGPAAHARTAARACPGALLSAAAQPTRPSAGVAAAWSAALLSGPPVGRVAQVHQADGAAVLTARSLIPQRSRLEPVLTEAEAP